MFRFAFVTLVALHLALALTPDDFKGKNVIVFMTDQERQVQHFPDNWVEENMPGLSRMLSNGVAFTKAYTASCMCSPARSSWMTGFFPAQHGVHSTLELNMPNSTYPSVNLPLDLPNLATVMKAAGYNVVYKGKFHLTNPKNFTSPTSYSWTAPDVEQYGWTRWTAPDAGANQELSEGGGNPQGGGNWDEYWMRTSTKEGGGEGVLEYLRDVAPLQQPFFLVVSLVNPHDVLFFPNKFNDSGYPHAMLYGPVGLPETVFEQLLPTKPIAQSFQNRLTNLLGGFATDEERLQYINFYANLMKKSDEYLVEILDLLDELGLTNDTIVVKTADHGEMGLAHGDMIQKSFVAYEEALNVPLVWSNPVLWPQPYVSDALISHVDFLPTLASLFNAPDSARTAWQGVDYSKLLISPELSRKAQDYIAFQFGDVYQGQDTGPYVPPPGTMYTIRESRYKFSIYYDPNQLANGTDPQYEMYDLKLDPLEKTNLAFSRFPRSDFVQAQYDRLKARLNTVIATRFKPLPLARGIDLNGTFNMVAQSSTKVPGVQAIEDEGPISGPPVGTGDITISWLFDFRTLTPVQGARRLFAYQSVCQFNITSRVGMIMGVSSNNMTLNGATSVIEWVGRANFTFGTAAFKGIKATNLVFNGSDNTEGTAGKYSITGTAYY